MNLCLGTVQLGMDYGIRHQKKPSLAESLTILDYATQNGIDHIDTANAYGNAEEVVGTFLQKKSIAREKLVVISKFRPNLLDDVDKNDYYRIMKENLFLSFQRLHTDYLDCYLLHSARYIFEDAIVDTLSRLKKEGYVRKVGVSVYETDEAKKGLERPEIDFIQLPYSIFDQRMEEQGVFCMAKEGTTQIHSRSAFLQGLITMTEAEVPDFLSPARLIVREINAVCRQYGLSKVKLAMEYVKRQTAISHLVFGVDNLEQLQDDIKWFAGEYPAALVEEIAQRFHNIDAKIIMPSLWSRK